MTTEKKMASSYYLDDKLLGLDEVELGMGYSNDNGQMKPSKEHIIPFGEIADRLANHELEEYDVKHTDPENGKTYHFTSNYEQEIATKFDMSGEAPIGPVVLKALGSLENKSQIMRSSKYFVYVYQYIDGGSRLKEKSLKAKMDSMMLKKAKDLSRHPEAFRNTYGSHMVTGTCSGGLLIVAGEKKSSSSQKQIKAAAEAYATLPVSAKIKLSFDAFKKTFTGETSLKNQVVVRGGMKLSGDDFEKLQSAQSIDEVVAIANNAVDESKKSRKEDKDYEKILIGASVTPYSQLIDGLDPKRIRCEIDYLNGSYKLHDKGSNERYLFASPSDQNHLIATIKPQSLLKQYKSYKMFLKFQNGKLIPQIKKYLFGCLVSDSFLKDVRAAEDKTYLGYSATRGAGKKKISKFRFTASLCELTSDKSASDNNTSRDNKGVLPRSTSSLF